MRRGRKVLGELLGREDDGDEESGARDKEEGDEEDEASGINGGWKAR